MGRGKEESPVPAVFQYSRVPRDRLWAALFAVAWVAAIALGCYAVTHRCMRWAAAELHVSAGWLACPALPAPFLKPFQQ